MPDRDVPVSAILPGGVYIRRFPWSRLWAKSIDLVTLGPLGAVAVLWLLPLTGLVQFSAISLAFPVLEAVVISVFGTSFGKAVFRIWVLSPGRRRLNPIASLQRSLMAWIIGTGAGIPLVSSILVLAARRRYLETGITRWDEAAGAVFTVMRPTFASWLIFLQTAGYALAFASLGIYVHIHPSAG